MTLLPIEEVLAELEGEDEHGRQTVLTVDDLHAVRSRFRDFAFTYPKKEGGRTVCSGCGEWLTRTVERPGDGILCPVCRKTVTVYDKWRGYKQLYQQMIVYTWHRSRKDPEVIFAKAIHAEKMFWAFGNPENTGLNAHVAAIYQFSPKGAKMYRSNPYHIGRNGFYANASSVTPEENKHGYNCEGVHAGFWDAVDGTTLGFVADYLKVRINGVGEMHPVHAMTEAARKPYLMHVILQGQERLALDMAKKYIKPAKRTAKNMPELLGITEGQWYEAKKNKLMLTADWLKALKAIQNAGKMEITFREARIAMDNNLSYSRYNLESKAHALLGRCTPKLRRKAVRRAALSKDLQEWVDYWEQLAQLHEDMTDSRILLPKDMHAMHQRMTDRINAIKQQQKLEMDAIMKQKFAARMKALKERYTFEACGLILRPFESAEEVVAEGAAQHICIGGYAQSYIQGKTILCALRRAECPEEPWRAVEFSVMTGLMVQDRGRYNDRGDGKNNKINGVEGWLRRFWAAFDAHVEAQKEKKARNAA